MTDDRVTPLRADVPFGIVRKPGQVCEPDRVLGDAVEQDLEQVVVVGVHPDGDLFLSASHNEPETVLLLSKALNIILCHAELREEDP